MGQLVFQATAGGQVALVGPNPSASFSLNVPAVNGNLVTTGDTGTVTNTMLASNVYTAPSTIGSGTPNTGAFTNLSYTGTLTGGTGIVNLGLGQFYKDASGNVGIGTASPTVKLDINGPLDPTTGIGIRLAATTSGANSKIQYTDATTSNWTAGTTGNAFTISNGEYPGTAGTERMRIDSSGNLLVGTTSNPTAAKVAYVQTSNGTVMSLTGGATSALTQIAFVNPNGIIGSVTTNGSATAYNTSSDYRLKENIAPMTGALDKVSALKPCTYDWINDKSKGQGFIAHELQAVVPDCVTGEKDAVDSKGNPVYQGVDTSFLVATLTAAIQELKAEFDAYKATHP